MCAQTDAQHVDYIVGARRGTPGAAVRGGVPRLRPGIGRPEWSARRDCRIGWHAVCCDHAPRTSNDRASPSSSRSARRVTTIRKMIIAFFQPLSEMTVNS